MSCKKRPNMRMTLRRHVSQTFVFEKRPALPLLAAFFVFMRFSKLPSVMSSQYLMLSLRPEK
jgi:hypothetical protein